MLGLRSALALALALAALLATTAESSSRSSSMRLVSKACGGRLGAAMPSTCKAPVAFKLPVCMFASASIPGSSGSGSDSKKNAVRPPTGSESKGFFRRPLDSFFLPKAPSCNSMW